MVSPSDASTKGALMPRVSYSSVAAEAASAGWDSPLTLKPGYARQPVHSLVVSGSASESPGLGSGPSSSGQCTRAASAVSFGKKCSRDGGGLEPSLDERLASR